MTNMAAREYEIENLKKWMEISDTLRTKFARQGNMTSFDRWDKEHDKAKAKLTELES